MFKLEILLVSLFIVVIPLSIVIYTLFKLRKDRRPKEKVYCNNCKFYTNFIDRLLCWDSYEYYKDTNPSRDSLEDRLEDKCTHDMCVTTTYKDHPTHREKTTHYKIHDNEALNAHNTCPHYKGKLVRRS
jgi:hypothetical protein